MQSGDTIVAISSAVTSGAARMIVRMSGPDATELSRATLDTTQELPDPGAAFVRRLRFRGLSAFPSWIYRFAAPRSVTGEDVIEFHLPGNALLARMLLDDLIHRGARQAEPGEFTARAFFNGRIDLPEAEGVAALVSAHSQAELDAARRLLSGELARRLAQPMESIGQTLALVEAGIDFVDEDVSFISAEEFMHRIGEGTEALRRLIRESSRFERLSHEPRVVLAGRANAGKSTLLNTLAGFERAIVSPVAGTTRDALGATVRLARGMVRVIDAAGLEVSSGSSIDVQMQSSTQRAIETADVVVLIHDCTDMRPLLELARPQQILIHSKSDLGGGAVHEGAMPVSAATRSGIDELRQRLDEICFGAIASPASNLALAARHARAIEDAVAALDRSRAGIAVGAEVAAMELRDALDALGSIRGQVTRDDILGQVFATFCIGK